MDIWEVQGQPGKNMYLKGVFDADEVCLFLFLFEDNIVSMVGLVG